MMKEHKMLEGPTSPLAIAKRRVLTKETLLAAAKSPYPLRGWKILDRWAMNSPKELQALEAKGKQALLARLLDQQELESKVLLDYAESLDKGMAEHEVLDLVSSKLVYTSQRRAARRSRRPGLQRPPCLP
jgi:hypothetical protein